MAVTRNHWAQVIAQAEEAIDKMTVSLEIQNNVLKFAKERIEKYPKPKPQVEEKKHGEEKIKADV